MTPTGVARLDDFFGGGIPDGVLVDVFGANGVGKTQLALQTAVHASRRGSVLFQDTCGTFRPERMLEIIVEGGLDPGLLDGVTVERVTNVSEQAGSLSGIKPDEFSFLIIDNVSELFSFEYSGKDRQNERNRRFMRYMRELSSLAAGGHIAVLFTNVVRNADGRQVQSFERIVDLFSHVRIMLEKTQTESGSGRTCTCLSAFGQTRFGFEIGASGIRTAGHPGYS